ncbi:MAG: carbohydrate ABC transporter permease [Caldilineaceae bacterium]
MNSAHQTRQVSNRIVAYLIALGAILLTLFPIVWILSISLKTQRDAFALPPSLFFRPIWDHHAAIWAKDGFRDAFFNSILVTVIGIVLAIAIAIFTAYALNRLQFRGKRVLMVWLLMAYMLPEFLFVIPMYALYQRIGLYDTHFGLALVYQVFVLPYAVWLLRSFFQEIPADLDDAAHIDGCTYWQTLRYVYIPVSAPGIAATAILAAIWIWNELTIALALTFSRAETVTVAVAAFRGYASIEWGPMTAASITAILPMLIFAAFAQKYIVKGLTLGSVK